MDFSGAVDLGKAPSTRVVEETNKGIYVWEMPNGAWVADDEGNWMNIPSVKGDLSKINMLKEAAKSYGITEGRPVFLSGHYRVSEDEYQEQRARLALGYVPDKNDIFSLRDEDKYGRYQD